MKKNNWCSLFLLTILVLAITSCKKDPIDLVTEVVEVALQENEVATVKIRSGSGEYSVKSSDETIATVVLQSSEILITGISGGETKIVLIDIQTKQQVIIKVIVKLPDLKINSSELNVTEEFTDTLVISSGSGVYELVVDDNSIATAQLNEDTIVVTGIAKGETHITVADKKSGQSINLKITVTEIYKITFTTTVSEGGNFSLIINTEEADSKGVWIDLDNNKKRAQNGDEDIKTGVGHVGFVIGKFNTLTIYGKVKELYLTSNSLISLDVSRNTALTFLECTGNNLTSLDVTKNINLLHLNCEANRLNTINVRLNKKLTYLNCTGNQLEELDVTQNTELKELRCNGNQLTSLDISQNVLMTDLDCSVNKVNSLDISNNKNLKMLYCPYNQIKAQEMSNILNALPQRSKEDEAWIFIYADLYPSQLIDQNEMPSVESLNTALGENWSIYKFEGETWKNDWKKWTGTDWVDRRFL